MMIVTINYTRPAMARAEWEARYTPERAQQFLSVPGLQWKIWLDGEEDRRAGGVYLFDTREAAQAYLDGPIVARMKANPDVADLQIRMFAVRESMTAITRGPVPGLAMAAE
jgi:hypothetical protein